MEYLNSWSFFETSKEHGIKQAVKKKKFLAAPINYNYTVSPPMPYETIIKQVKILPEAPSASVSACIKLLESAQCNFTENYAGHAKPKNKQAFLHWREDCILTGTQLPSYAR